MLNKSKIRQSRWWIKLWRSGAIKQPEFPPGTLVVDAIVKHADGTQTLSLGPKPIRPGGISQNHHYYAVVPLRKKYHLGQVLDELPKNAFPAELLRQKK